jgi:acetylglutamate kinase
MINVVKIGGGIIEDPEQLQQFLNSFAQIKGDKILVHGGGRLATTMATKLGIESKMVEGRRITDDATLEVVTMVYGGLANKNIVAQLQSLGINALGLTGADGNLILSHKRQNSAVDYGWVGDVDAVNVSFLKTLLQAQITPIVAPLTHNGQGKLLNTNADTIASEIANSLAKAGEKVQLIFGFELEGVLLDFNDKSSVIPEITTQKFAELKAQNIISEGMIPKLTNAFASIQAGVSAVKICHALKVGEAVNASRGTSIVQ